MRLTFSTDYALRLLMLVGLETKRLVTIEEVADRFGISKNHLMKVAYQLGQTGYLETIRGRNGGLRLVNKRQAQIVVGEVVRKNGTGLRSRRMSESGRLLQDRALLYAAFCNGRSCSRRFFQKLDEYTLEDLLRPKSKLRHLLGINKEGAFAPGSIRAEFEVHNSCVRKNK